MIIAKQRTVYFSSLRGVHYQSKRAACIAEAREIIKEKYPDEPHDPECGGGWCWQEIKRSDVLLRRMARIVRANMQQPAKEETK